MLLQYKSNHVLYVHIIQAQSYCDGNSMCITDKCSLLDNCPSLPSTVSPAPGKCWQMSSFGESTATKLSKESAVKYVTYNKVQVSRTYPKGSRVDSSNYDPTPMWNAGCQIGA